MLLFSLSHYRAFAHPGGRRTEQAVWPFFLASSSVAAIFNFARNR